MKFKPYEEYKKVDLPWIDEIPSHWDMERNKNFLTVKDETVGNKDKNYKLLSLTKKGIIERDMENPKGKFPSSFETYKIVEKNDIIFCLFDIDETPRTVGLSKLDGMITGAYNIFSINKINKNYYYYYYLYLDKFKMLKPLYTGLRKTINEDAFLRLRTPLPPKEEQDKIADFLDHNLAKIDKFVELTERQIELLKEQKEVLINDAVTKGIDKNVEYKDSGIDWIGEIPEHWEVTRLKYISQILNGGTPSSSVPEFWNGDISWVTPKDLSKVTKYVYASDRKITKEGYKNCSTSLIPENNIIMATRAPIGNIRINKIETTINQGCKGILVDKNLIDLNYLYFLLNNYLKELQLLGNGATFVELSTNNLSQFKINIPPIVEQQQIVSYIDEETNKIDRTIELYKNQIELIKEYRTSLIASAVTGKIDVRDF